MKPGAPRLLVAAACLGLLFLPRTATGSWTKPAGGQSASGDPEVLFTFDDGPHERHTAAILDELDRRGIQAIFFWVGWRVSRGKHADERLELVQRAVRSGHLVANHTVTHPHLCRIKAEQAAAEIDDNVRIFEEASELPMLLFRAPYGARCKRLEELLAERSLNHMHWDIDPQEWSHHNTRRTIDFVVRRLDRLEGRAIVILHDTHLVTAQALPGILDWIEAENARREKSGEKRPIRIITGSQLVAERMDAQALEWASGAARSSARRLETLLQRLIP